MMQIYYQQMCNYFIQVKVLIKINNVILASDVSAVQTSLGLGNDTSFLSGECLEFFDREGRRSSLHVSTTT